MGDCAIGRAAAIVPLLVVVLLVDVGLGHDIRMSARVEGRQIVGKVYVRGGGPVAGATVTAFGPDNRQFDTTQTDEEGVFRLPVRLRCDHRLLADAGDGHGAEYLIKANLLPDDLPATDKHANAHAPQTHQPPASQQTSAAGHSDAQTPAPANVAQWTDEVKQLRGEIDDLREQLDQYRQRVRLLDVLGGIGYILGLTGIAHYWLSLRRSG